MRARWVVQNPSPELPIVGQARVASWWPGSYYIVSTIQIDASDPLHRLTETIERMFPHEETTLCPGKYVTQVFKCSKDGIVRSFNEPLYELEYQELAAARAGHEETVVLLLQGRLKLGVTAKSEYNKLRASVGMAPARDDDCCEYVAWVVVFDLASQQIADECKGLPVDDRGLFMMVAASYLTWVAMTGVESSFPHGSWRFIAPLIERELSKKQWYQAEVMKSIFDSMVRYPPISDTKGSQLRTSLGPWPKAVMAAKLAGHLMAHSQNIEFVVWVGIISGKILETIRKVAANG